MIARLLEGLRDRRRYRILGETGSVMTSRNIESASVLEVAGNVKRMGYAVSSRVRLYGENFEVLSDPFPEAGGNPAIHVKAKRDEDLRAAASRNGSSDCKRKMVMPLSSRPHW